MSYIGQTTKSLKDRKKEHMIKANHTDFYFHRALKKYDKNRFEWEIIKKCKNYKELIHLEQLFIKQFNTKVPNGYNMTDGGEGTLNRIIRDETRFKLKIANLGKYPSEETRKKLINSHKGKSNPNKGKKLSKEWRENLSKSHKGYKQTEEHKRKRIESMKGYKGYWLGKSFSKMHKKRLSESGIKAWINRKVKLSKVDEF